MKKYSKHSIKANEKKQLTTTGLWKNKEYRKKQRISSKKSWESIERKNNQSEKMKQCWSKYTDKEREEIKEKIPFIVKQIIEEERL